MTRLFTGPGICQINRRSLRSLLRGESMHYYPLWVAAPPTEGFFLHFSVLAGKWLLGKWLLGKFLLGKFLLGKFLLDKFLLDKFVLNKFILGNQPCCT
jgi:hypothetical protein